MKKYPFGPLPEDGRGVCLRKLSSIESRDIREAAGEKATLRMENLAKASVLEYAVPTETDPKGVVTVAGPGLPNDGGVEFERWWTNLDPIDCELIVGAYHTLHHAPAKVAEDFLKGLGVVTTA